MSWERHGGVGTGGDRGRRGPLDESVAVHAKLQLRAAAVRPGRGKGVVDAASRWMVRGQGRDELFLAYRVHVLILQ